MTRAEKAKRRGGGGRCPPQPGTAAGGDFDVVVERLGGRGDGVAQAPDGGRLYIPRTLPGERVRVRLGGAQGDGLAARPVDILAPSADRAEPPCPHFARCGGCALQHLPPAAATAWKVDRLVAALDRAGFGGYALAPAVRAGPGERRRATFAAERGAGAASPVALGFAEGRSHAIVDLATCLVLAPRLVAVLPALRELLDEILPRGRRTRVAAALLDGGLDLVLDWPKPPDAALFERLAGFAHAADVARLSWRRDAEAPAETVVTLRPVAAVFAGIAVAVPAAGFLQATAGGAAALVDVVLAATRDGGAVADLFSGAGAFALPLSAAGHRVHAVDADAPAIAALAAAARADPRVATERRNLFTQPLDTADLRRFDAVVFDPPRAGARAQAQALANSAVPVVVAVSCNPDTFVRDAKTLAAGGYRLASLTPVDQFLWSAHLELAAVFVR